VAADGEPATPLAVLVVDDDPAVARFVATALWRMGVPDVRIAHDGNEALKADVGADSGIGLVVTDLQMPELDGIAFLRHLAARGYRGAVLLMSGADERLLKAVEGLGRSLDLNVLGVLSKPIHPADLAKAVGRVRAPKAGVPRAEVEVSVDELRSALGEGRIEAFFQPQADVKTGRVVGAEALARWRHPEKGLILPDAFVGLAEEHGLVDALLDRVLADGLRASGAWRRAGHDVRVAVNLSFRNLHRLTLPEELERLAKANGVPPSGLTVEVTESSVAQQLAASLEILTRLRLRNIGLSIDDFGTGFATMDHLKQFPFTELKIDQGFVRAAADDRTARTIVESSVFLARRLGMTTVAEGVETSEQWDLVARLGVDVAQGWALARPMPEEEFRAWLGARGRG
jgi:EAL domain-containing protein (putative c-di-GMP-specific phosphodiesterase class I)/FixJ family two-component response regulator